MVVQLQRTASILRKQGHVGEDLSLDSGTSKGDRWTALPHKILFRMESSKSPYTPPAAGL